MMLSNVVDWITALLICRYGEAEYNWPAEFSDADITRAVSEWEVKGRMPEGCRYLQ